MTERSAITVGGERPYDVVIGTGVHSELADAVAGAEQVAVIHQPTLTQQAQRVLELLRANNITAHSLAIPDGEAAKTLRTAGECFEGLGRLGLTRTDVVVGLGGGAATDLAGWVAASWLRGVRLVQVPTTVLGMVDAAVGGKTGINTAAGKNLVGAFYPPAQVICDLDLLSTLPSAELVGGLGEIVKCGFIADPVILDLIESDPAAAVDPRSDLLRELVTRSVQVKADVVTLDLREAGLRESLNYGHTLAHAIELREGFTWRHGEAVAVGMMFAAELSRRAAGLADDVAARHGRVLRLVGLPTGYDRDAFPDLHRAMFSDKKTRGSRLRFVTLPELGRTDRLEAPDDGLLAECYATAVAG